jgi:hypothetical protein
MASPDDEERLRLAMIRIGEAMKRSRIMSEALTDSASKLLVEQVEKFLEEHNGIQDDGRPGA